MRTYDEDIFGPLAPATTFADDVEAIACNDSRTDSRQPSIPARTTKPSPGGPPHGGTHINEPTIGDEAVVPFPAIKASGNGSVEGPAIEKFTRWQWTTTRTSQVPTQVGGA